MGATTDVLEDLPALYLDAVPPPPSLLLPLPVSLLYTHSLLLPLPVSLLYTHSLLLPLPVSLLYTPSVDNS